MIYADLSLSVPLASVVFTVRRLAPDSSLALREITSGLLVIQEVSPGQARHNPPKKTGTDFRSTRRTLLRLPCVVLFAVDIGMIF
jgi:hypothetical protein